jgi:hypothetical protein
MIDEATVVQIAREAAQAEGWAFVEPVECVLRRDWRGRGVRWEIRTNAGRFGAIARFVISAIDGRVIQKGYVPR